MLKLKRVDIQGFKSFYDRTEMRFHGSGIAAIVGPNGCGKSNLSDAISWVLGEQSAKTLRGTRMEDVIFAGTRERKPLGHGAGHPDDGRSRPRTCRSTGHAPSRPEHTNGTRNGHRTATAKRSRHEHEAPSEDHHHPPPVPLRRKRIPDQRQHAPVCATFRICSAAPASARKATPSSSRAASARSSRNKPADRRAIIEEAAGIGKYKTRKRLAEAKLESARQNLSRVFDILEEVGRQVNSLKRQASKARRYEELRTRDAGASAPGASPAASGCWSAKPRNSRSI